MKINRLSGLQAFPGREAFRALSQKGNLIPVYKDVLADTITPVSAYMMLGETPSFLLESVVGGEKWARYSFLGLKPSAVITARGNKIELTKNGEKREFEADPIGFAQEFMKAFVPVETDGLPRFYGGLVGYMGYDMVRFIEELPDKKAEGIPAPGMFLMLTDTMLVFDGLKQTVKVLANVHLEKGMDPGLAYDEAVAKIDAVIEKLGVNGAGSNPVPGAAAKGGEKVFLSPEFRSSFGSREDFMHAVERAKEYVMAGDIVQVVLSQRFEKRTQADPFDIYRALRVINPSPYMYFINTGDVRLVGSSPEILVRLEGRDITLRPIAGTRRRGRAEEEDMALEGELKADPKEVAEHIMLVDLGRNDVGRVAETGSVRIPELMVVERYSHVMHMVSNVLGKLKKGLGPFDVLRACFPAGTVSGAPKVRAMQIIEELEPVKRGPYAGAVGYFSYSGNMDTCITIRTLIIKGDTAYVQAGAGIVADSVPELEYTETVNKAKAMMEAVNMAEGLFPGGAGE
ncbi:MAG: anthranilate synthase component I [Nitrospiraceae bacterium]|nr:anthranilate synthase component I [Nitrospiraceae bacterium]